MSRYKAVVGYDGTAYSGWQVQPYGWTVAGQIEEALFKLTGTAIAITGAGRTDAGVHSRGQVFHFDCSKTTIKDYAAALNAVLPRDIYVYSCQMAAADFHARFDARYKEYEYCLDDGPFEPTRRNCTLFVSPVLDEAAMQQAAAAFIGQHDFTSFNASSRREYPDQHRTIYDIRIERRDHMVSCRYWGDGFLRHQIRMMTAALIQAGYHKTDAAQIADQLSACDKRAVSYNLPPCGLYLNRVSYNDYPD